MSDDKIKKFSEYNEGFASLGSKMRRVVTGQSAGEEIQKLSQSQQDKLTNLYREDPEEAAKYLRSIIVKEKNSQFGLGLALTIAGAGMIYKANNIEPPPKPPPPPPPPPPDVEPYIVKKGDSIWKIASELLGPGHSNDEIMSYTKQIAAENGMNLKLIDGVLTKAPGDPDLIFPGNKLLIPGFKP